MQDLLTSRNLCLLFGVVLVAVGVLGFVPNPLVSETGLFAVNTMHNLVHIVSGLAFLSGPFAFKGQESQVLMIMSVVYGLVAVLGFFMVGEDAMLLGMIHVNEADKWLHVLLAIAFGASWAATREA